MNRDTLAVDFVALAVVDPDFAKIWTASEGYIDFQDPDTVQQLTKSILKKEFGLNIVLPSDRLCPPVPVRVCHRSLRIRYSYIKWIQALIDSTSESFTITHDPERDVIGIDIGVGASCIYPLLGCASRSTWRFGGSEIDQISYEYATQNIAANNLRDRIRLCKVHHDSPVIPIVALGLRKADFVMCNPPFFTSKTDMLAIQSTKRRLPSAICSGAEIEMITDGGDLGFASRIIEESLKLHCQIQWYTCLLGKLSSVAGVVGLLKKAKVTNWAIATFQAGNVTKRWAVAWSFDDLRPLNSVARGQVVEKEILPFPTEIKIESAQLHRFDLNRRLSQILNLPAAKWSWNPDIESGRFFSKDNVWSRSARRRLQRALPSNEAKNDQHATRAASANDTMNGMSFGVELRLSADSQEIKLRWLKGCNHVLFESFSGMLRRCITAQSDDEA